MSFDPVSYAAGKKAGGGGGGREPVLERLEATENGRYTPDEGVDGFDSVEVTVPISEFLNPLGSPAAGSDIWNGLEAYDDQGNLMIGTYTPHFEPFEPLVDQATAGDILSGKEAYDDQGNVISGSYVPHFAPLDYQAVAGDIRYGQEAYDDQGNVISGTLTNLHRPIPCYWDATNGKFAVTQALLLQMMNTIAVDGAITAYLVNSETAIPIPCVVHTDANQNVVLTGGICVVDGSDTDKYIVYCNVGADGSISNEKNSLIRLALTVSRRLADWMADGDYLSLFLLA